MIGKALKYSFYYILEKAERRKRKNRKKKEIKKERKAQQLKERSSGKITFVSVVIAQLSAKSSQRIVYVCNNVCPKGVMCS